MPEIIVNKQVFSLSEVAQSIKATLARRYTSSFWVKAEMNKLNHFAHSGHCYPDLIQNENGKTIAQLRGFIRKTDFLRINQVFLNTLNEPLKDGIAILFSASITFDAFYGLSLQIHDIDPIFTLGTLEREKTETIEKLKKEGIFDRNKQLPFPLLPKRIAVISVQTSKGYADFTNRIESKSDRFRIEYMLFPSNLQGDQAIVQIQQRLKEIERNAQHFDLVAIIRGGGAEVGLSKFNNYRLSKAIAEFPLPVLTGIGHSTNFTVSEMVAHTNAITPSALAEILFECFERFDATISRAISLIKNQKQLIQLQKNALKNLQKWLSKLTSDSMSFEKKSFDSLINQMNNKSSQKLEFESDRLFVQLSKLDRFASETIRKEKESIRTFVGETEKFTTLLIQKQLFAIEKAQYSIGILDPQNVLKRGYSMTLLDGKVVKDFADLKVGAELTTILHEGKIKSRIESKKENHER
ncbi:MAG: exodeoxyribonuclease VII large subunit [Lentimicrobiaceae bacterium]|jgi:exodeoxyribonuclease VII large subunit|nr:exodeoxyribonuclease VII large subunit [Lentimicrobiaceae bacterium]